MLRCMFTLHTSTIVRTVYARLKFSVFPSLPPMLEALVRCFQRIGQIVWFLQTTRRWLLAGFGKLSSIRIILLQTTLHVWHGMTVPESAKI